MKYRDLIRFLTWFGTGALLLTGIALATTALFEQIVKPTDMHLAGLLSAVLMIYLLPLGALTLAVAGLMKLGISIIIKKHPRF